MPKYVDVDALERKLMSLGEDVICDDCLLEVLGVLDHFPAADVEPKRRWIPVAERLPECGVGAEIGNVEWIIHDMVFAGCFGRGGKYRDAYFRTWTDTTEGIDAKDADCWRVVTLPEAPKGEEKKKAAGGPAAGIRARRGNLRRRREGGRGRGAGGCID